MDDDCRDLFAGYVKADSTNSDAAYKVPVSEDGSNGLISLINPTITIDAYLGGKDFARVMTHEFGYAAFTLNAQSLQKK